MKKITNWRNATVFDIEADSLLEDATKIHILSYQMQGGEIKSIKGTNSERIKKFFVYHMVNGIPVVAQNGIGYDKPLIEKLLGINLSGLMVIDTMGLSWYLNTERRIHGLGSFHEDYGIEKVVVADDEWILSEDATPEEAEEHAKLMKLRCQDDIKINKALWEDLKERLIGMYTQVRDLVDNYEIGGKRVEDSEVLYIDRYVGNSTVDDYIDRILTFLNYKLDCAALQEKTMWDVDVPAMGDLQGEYGVLLGEAKESLEGIMDEVPKYSPKNRPKKPFKKNGELSASGLSWEEAIKRLSTEDHLGHPLTKMVEDKPDVIKVLKGYDPPKVTSSAQIKALLFKHGWEPESFEYKTDKDAQQSWVDSGFRKDLKPTLENGLKRKVPQVSVEGEKGKELCPSVRRLIAGVPEIASYEKYTTIKHRSDMIKGWEESLIRGKYLQATIGGFTNTLRVKHKKPLANIPGTHKPYGEEIRGLLIAGKGKILLGSDLSALEDRVKHHFMLAFDPEYVATMMEDGYCPHLYMALEAKLISQQDMDEYKSGNKQSHVVAGRRAGKSTNYASVYGAGAETVARAAGVPLELGNSLVKTYKELNWSVQAIADDQTLITCKEGKKWLVNPVNGFLYSLRSDKDIFSTLCQGTGSFFFDIWLDNVLTGMEKEFGVKRLTGSFHDEFIACFKDTQSNRDKMEKITLDAIEQVNAEFLMRRKLGAGVSFGSSYDLIH